MKGIFLTIEGLDGAGKTTQLGLLRDWFWEKGYDPLFTREPGGTRLGDGVRELLLSREYTGLVPLTEAFLYAASRAQLVAEVIVPALKAGRPVVCDRFVDSSIAYQGYGRGLPRDFLEGINRRATGDLEPHLTLLLDLNPALRLRRLAQEGVPRDRLEVEGDAFYTRVREGYLSLARENPRRIKVISAQQSVQAVHGQIVQQVVELFRKRTPCPKRRF
ncbi:MAG: dTMP kinase [Firmicutes bacterium]|nr:dTMP kinase [Bacillota bacterium]